MKPCLVACLLSFCLTGCPSSMQSAGGTGGLGAGGAGAGGSCGADEVPIQQLVSTEVACELSGLPTQCGNVCDLHCADNDFELGAIGSGCAMEREDTAYCRCVCAYCRLR